MAKKAEITDNGNSIIVNYPTTFNNASAMLRNLTISGIASQNEDGTITWRTGHLEHIANLYAGDPQTTERDYADDLAVARAYSREQWEALIAPPQA